tara:strand:+ start:22 stop:477 length:456 start_codon:yes stop_codon:yes gene_type:complete
MSDRKKFKNTVVGQILLGAASAINPTLGKVLEGVTSPKEALSKITQSDISSADKIRLQEMIYDQQVKESEAVTARWQADMASDNNLSKSVRPLVLVFLIVCTILLIFVDSGFINFVVDSEWKDLLKVLLMTTVAAYFGGRSYEKGQKIKNK